MLPDLTCLVVHIVYTNPQDGSSEQYIRSNHWLQNNLNTTPQGYSWSSPPNMIGCQHPGLSTFSDNTVPLISPRWLWATFCFHVHMGHLDWETTQEGEWQCASWAKQVFLTRMLRGRLKEHSITIALNKYKTENNQSLHGLVTTVLFIRSLLCLYVTILWL